MSLKKCQKYLYKLLNTNINNEKFNFYLNKLNYWHEQAGGKNKNIPKEKPKNIPKEKPKNIPKEKPKNTKNVCCRSRNTSKLNRCTEWKSKCEQYEEKVLNEKEKNILTEDECKKYDHCPK